MNETDRNRALGYAARHLRSAAEYLEKTYIRDDTVLTDGEADVIKEALKSAEYMRMPKQSEPMSEKEIDEQVEKAMTGPSLFDEQVPSFSSISEPGSKPPVYERITWMEFHTFSKMMADYLKPKENGNRIFVAVTRDGLFPAGIISHILNHRLVDTICVTSRDDTGKSVPVQIIKKPDASWVQMAGGANLVFIDAISDSGRTAEAIKTLYPACTYVVMVAKTKGIAAVDYYAQVVSDRWILFPWDNDPTS